MERRWTRRRLLKTGASAFVGLAACKAGDSDSDAPSDLLEPGDVLLGLYGGDGEAAVRSALARMDLGWLGAGDTVLIKVACNSGNPHPATTSPAAVRALCGALLDRGAGRVIVGDQAGVEYVRNAEGGRFGSTRALMGENGLLAAIEESGGEPYFFDEQDYEAGYVEVAPPAGSGWSQPMFIPRIVTEVDHLVYLPRLSSHVLAGYTHGHKLAMGWLRDDSRFHVHNDAATLHEKYTEINYVPEIASRLRLVLTLAERILLDGGPDEGTIADVDPRIVIASDSLARHDALSVAALAAIDEVTEKDPEVTNVYGPGAGTSNAGFTAFLVPSRTGIPWGDGATASPLPVHDYQNGIAQDRSLTRAFAILGGVPAEIPVLLDGAAPDEGFRAFLEAHQGGIFQITG